jgi:hypothetical protein
VAVDDGGFAAQFEQLRRRVKEICRGDPACPGHPQTARVVQLSVIGADGSGLELLPMVDLQNPALRPLDDN